MSDTKMVDLPWADGNTRTVPEWTVYMAVNGYVYFARDGGYSYGTDQKDGPVGTWIFNHHNKTVAVRIFGELSEPPVKANVPTSLGAIVSPSPFSNNLGYVLTQNGWCGLFTGRRYNPSEIADELRLGARVFYEGDDRKAAPEPPLPELPTQYGALIAEFRDGQATGHTWRRSDLGTWGTVLGNIVPPDDLRHWLRDGKDGCTYRVVFTGEGTPVFESGE